MTTTILMRSNIIPEGIMIFKDNTVIPDGYNLDSSYDNKYLKQVPNAGTNPGNLVGSTGHTHSSDGGHTHTPSTGAHTHTGTTGLGVSGIIGGGTGSLRTSNTHSHSITGASESPTVTVGNVGAHTHDAQSNDPQFRTFRLLKKTSVINIRQRSLPFEALIFWPKTLSTIPSHFTADTNIFSRLFKPNPTAGTDGGRINHGHNAFGIVHNVALTSHSSHVISVTDFTPLSGVGSGIVASDTFEDNPHGHTSGGTTVGASAPNSNNDSPTHTHNTIVILPASKETALIKINNLTLRTGGVPINAVVLWEDLNADIPIQFNLADGTNGSDNYLDKYIVGPPNGSTDPGSNIGTNTHQHASQSHNHTNVILNHTHTLSGTTGSTVGGGQRAESGGALAITHSHDHNATDSSGPTISFTSAGGHQHASLDHKPDSKEVSLIQRI